VARQAEGLDERYTLRTHLTIASCPITGDRDRLEHVLVNLLDNAVKYMPGGGDILVTLEPADGGALVTVQDQGIGLPPGTAESIFEPFGRAPNAAERHLPGMGLGLSICRSIVERHGGRIWAASEGEDRGTTLSVWLPTAEHAGSRPG
jgi:signal transduction histidine kinase